MRKRLYGLIAVALLMVFPSASCRAQTSLSAVGQPSKNEAKQQENPYAKAEITTRVIPSLNNTFGYDILLDGKPLVHQPSIPGLPGNEGFHKGGSADRSRLCRKEDQKQRDAAHGNNGELEGFGCIEMRPHDWSTSIYKNGRGVL